MNIKRIAKHLLMTHWRVRRVFSQEILAEIETAIQTVEAAHGGEICFAVEGALDTAPLFRGQSARARAIEVFSQLRVWDTEHNNGVLIYLLLADRAVEIIADRGIHAKAGPNAWGDICRAMEMAFRQARYKEGVIDGIQSIAAQLVKHFPAGGQERNEFPDQPILL